MSHQDQESDDIIWMLSWFEEQNVKNVTTKFKKGYQTGSFFVFGSAFDTTLIGQPQVCGEFALGILKQIILHGQIGKAYLAVDPNWAYSMESEGLSD